MRENVRIGLFTSMANPQTALSFATYLLIAGDSLRPASLLLIGGPVVVATTLLWYGAVIIVLTNPISRKQYLACRRPLDAAFGCVIIYSAARLLAGLAK